jgi:hypothetical protein
MVKNTRKPTRINRRNLRIEPAPTFDLESFVIEALGGAVVIACLAALVFA